MKQQVLCPECKWVLEFDPSTHRNSGVCPVCTSLVPAKDLANPLTERSSALTEDPQRTSKELLSLADYLASLKGECRALAARSNIDLTETFGTYSSNKGAPFNQYLEAREELPEVPGYRTRNILPAGALGWLMLGVLFAIPAALAMELLASSLAAGVIAFSADTLQNYTGSGLVVAAVVGFLSFFAPFIAGGWVCARVITMLGRRRKNRHRWVGGFLASAAAGTTVLILWAVHLRFGREPFRAWDPFKMGPNLDVFTNLLFGMNLLIAIVSGARFAAGMIQRERFCEECQEFMNPIVSRNLRAGAIKTMLVALADGSISLAASLLEVEGGDSTVSLSCCPVCGGGILEVTVSIETVNKNMQFYRASWCVASMNLKKQEVDWFRGINDCTVS